MWRVVGVIDSFLCLLLALPGSACLPAVAQHCIWAWLSVAVECNGGVLCEVKDSIRSLGRMSLLALVVPPAHRASSRVLTPTAPLSADPIG